MVQKIKYRTKQMEEILAYLKSVQGTHVTVGDICNHFSKMGTAVGITTIYRHLDRLVEQGLAAKYTVDGTTGACFEYLGGDSQAGQSICCHCKCENCGRLIHLQCEEVTELERHILASHGFEINAHRTVFYGLCDKCREK